MNKKLLLIVTIIFTIYKLFLRRNKNKNIINDITKISIEKSIIEKKSYTFPFSISSSTTQKSIKTNKKSNIIPDNNILSTKKNKTNKLVKTKHTKNINFECKHMVLSKIIEEPITSIEPNGVDPQVNPNIFTGLTPLQLKTAYNIPTIIPKSTQSIPNITIIIAYHYSKLQADLDTYSNFYNLPLTTLNIINLASTNIDTGIIMDWALEECLDVQMAHAINPYAKITVIEAKSNSFNDMFNAIIYANSLPNTQIISMSWGSNEFSSQTVFAKYISNNKVCYCASSGDNNYASFPSTLDNVISVGGTTLNLTSTNTRLNEITWSSAGCGISKYTNKPDYQNNIQVLNNKKRAVPDISCVGNPNTGVRIYYNGSWVIVGGTSVSCPIVAGIISLANCQRLINNKTTLTSIKTQNNQLQNFIYQKCYVKNIYPYSQNFYDVRAGNDGQYTATINYDIATGLGVPTVTTLVQSLLNA
jgi:subtilase family serine protease